MLNILIADDHPVVRQGVKQILADSPGLASTDEASDGQEVLEKIRNSDYDIVLLDITMPGMTGLDILKELKRQKPEIPVLILSIHPEEQYAIRVLRAGASGYLTKNSVPSELIAAIKKVSAGGKYISPSLAEGLASKLQTSFEIKAHETLSDREYHVLCLLASGKSAKKIAEELSLSVKTISTYRSRILEKMQMKNNVELIRYAIQNGLCV